MLCPKCDYKLMKMAAHGRMLWVHAFLVDESAEGCYSVGLSLGGTESPYFRKLLQDDGSLTEGSHYHGSGPSAPQR